ncbi:hemolysin III family protein [uncultured Cytophaga sp.]|uniref:PAQR family membrane homeostasis protein TrhA n=1 Tax=uncultured Cytophaga sp. TaxID=160238 RepID=UPI0026195A68|nr:hemolysin III family protein [uncultured Cytophaga sp.]
MESEKKLDFEEKLNGISHGIAAAISFIGLLILAYYGAIDNRKWSFITALIFGISLVFTYSASMLYHLKSHKPWVGYRVIDHISIFILIAGTYSPILLIHIKGDWGINIFILQWTLAILGICLKLFFTGKVDLLFVLMYLVMGSIIVLKIDDLLISLPHIAFILMVVGGLAYSIGIIFYIIDKKMKYAHLIWHLFVIVGSVSHYLLITVFIL